MSVLNSWQKITRVLPGQPFGSGADGAYSSASVPSLSYKSCSGTASSTTLSADTDASPYSVGDVLLLIQMRGTGAGQWEVNRVSAVGSDEYTMQVALKYTYTDSGNSQAQAIKIPQYTNATVESGTWTIPSWGGDTGGVLAFAVKGVTTITGTINGSSKGYAGANGTTGSNGVAHGEGTQGPSLSWPSALQDTGGSGGGKGYGGGGGGNINAGSNGSGGFQPGYGGDAVGTADLTSIFPGGGGGSGATANEIDGDGGAGGGIVIIFANNIVITGSASNNGGSGESTGNGSGGGGGAGGSTLLVCKTATLGSSLVQATAGSAGTGNQANGGNGSVGIVAVHHSDTVTGTTNPTFEDVTDGSLVETMGSVLLPFL